MWKRSEYAGRIWRYVYDPVLSLSVRLSFEAQLRAWLALPSSLSDYKNTNFKEDGNELSRHIEDREAEISRLKMIWQAW